MRVILEPGIFPALSLREALPLLWLGATGRHRILIGDPTSAAYLAWLASIDAQLRAEWTDAVARGFSLDGKEPSHHEVRVARRDDSVWSQPTPSLTIRDAIDLLQRPYRVLVESGFSDRAFLFCCYTPRERAWLKERIEREWVEIEHCGGILDLQKRAKILSKKRHMSMRCSALFDSDALRPGEPSAHSRNTKAACEPEIHHHQLERRAIENYLPRQALDIWIKLVYEPQRSARAASVEALFALREAGQRAHFNMKEGFGGDARRAHEVGNLYDVGLSVKARDALREGFGNDVATLYQEYEHDCSSGLAHDVGTIRDRAAVTSVQAFAREIVERIR
jgi:hypothetical protein